MRDPGNEVEHREPLRCLLGLVFTSDASTSVNTIIIISPENSLDAGINTSTRTRIKIVPFSCTCAHACVYAATSENYRSGVTLYYE